MPEQLDIRIEVDHSHVVMVLPRKMDDFPTPWQNARELGTILEQAAGDVPAPPRVINWAQVKADQAQIRMTRHKKLVVMLFEHTDGIRLCPEAAKLVGRALRKVAQDAELAARGVHMVYNRRGELQQIVQGPQEIRQIIPGRWGHETPRLP